MTDKEALQILEDYINDTIDHACYQDGDEYGIYPCCYIPDYKKHTTNCLHSKIKAAFLILKEKIK